MSSINSLEFAEKFTGEVDKAIVQGAKTSFMEDSDLKAQFVGAKTVLIPSIEMLALGDYDRDTGYAKGSITVSQEPYTLTQERGREFNIDRMDKDEIGIASDAGTTMSDFVKEKVIPEIESYSLSKVAALAVERGNAIKTAEFPLETHAFKAFDKAYTETMEKIGDGELICLCSYDYWSALRNTPGVEKKIDVGNFKSGEINRTVKKIDNVSIIPVPSSRMYSAYLALSGKADDDGYEGGLVPAEGAHKVKFILMTPDTARRVRKLEKIKIFTADDNQEKDAYKFQFRLYYDVLIKKSKRDIPFVLYEV